MHPLTRPQGPRKSKCGNELWKQWTEFKPRHVFLRRVSGNGSRPKIKKKKQGRGGSCFREKRAMMKLLPPHHPPTPGKNAMDGTWCRVGGQGWGPLEFQV